VNLKKTNKKKKIRSEGEEVVSKRSMTITAKEGGESIAKRDSWGERSIFGWEIDLTFETN